MSYNPSRVEKSDGHVSKSGRPGFSGHQRGFSGGSRGRAGGGSGGSSVNQPSLSANRSFQKSGNGQGGQPRVDPASVISEANTVSATGRTVQNGAHGQHPLHGSSNTLPPAATKPVDMAILKTSIDPTKAPPSQASAGTSGSAAPSTQSKGDGGTSFSLQFGSISPGIVNGMQIPARTTSAPPNLDEQNQDQVHKESFNAPIPSGSKQQQPPLRKNVGSVTGDTHPPVQLKRDIQPQFSNAVRAPPPKPVTLPSPGMSMAIPYRQPQVPMQFGGHGPQPIPMSLPIGNAPQVPQQMFVHNLQSHSLQPQAIIHQGQGLGFLPQISRQLAPQIGNLGIGISNPQLAQQRGQFAGSRQTTVTITHPETHEELRLNKRTDVYTGGASSGQMSPPNATPQSRPIPSFIPSHYFAQLQPNPYFFSTNAPMPAGSQVPRFSYPIGQQSGQAISIMNPPVQNSMPSEKIVPPLHGSSKPMNPEPPVSSPSAAVHGSVKLNVITCGPKVGGPSVTISKPASIAEAPKMVTQPIEAILSHQPRENEVFADSSLQHSETVSELQGTTAIHVFSQQSAKAASDVSAQRAQLGTSSAPSAPAGVSGAVSAGTDGRKKESIRRTDSLKDQQKMSSKKDLQPFRQQQQVNVSASEADKNSSSVNIFENGSSQDIQSGHFSKNLHNNQDSSGTPASTTAVNLLSHGDMSITVEARSIEVIKGKTGPAGSGSSGVLLKKEELAQIPLLCSDHVELPTDCKIAIKKKDPLETSTISVLGVDGSISNDLKSTRHQADHSSIEFEPSKGTLEDTTMLECSSAKVHPVPILAECYRSLKPVVIVKEKDNCESALENHIVYNGQDSKSQQLVALAAEKSAEVKDGPVTFVVCSKAETVSSSDFPLVASIKDGPSSANDTINRSKTICSSDVDTSAPGASYPPTASIQGTLETANEMRDVTGLPRDCPAHATLLKDKYTMESNKSKPFSGKKKKRRELLSKADAAGTSDLYNAYKGPEEKHQHSSTSEGGDNSVTVDGENISADDPDKDVDTGEEDQQIKAELEDWEDAADAATPKLDDVEEMNKYHDNDEIEARGTKKYTRDFLLTFSEQCIDLPLDFQIGSDIANGLMSASVSSSRVIDHNHNHSPGRIKDRSPGGSRGDCRMVGSMDDDKWMKGSGSFNLRDLRGDVGHLASLNFPPGPGVNHGVLRNPRGQPPTQYVGGILSGPMQSIAPQGGFARNSADADRWRTGNSRGLMPPPQTPMQVMHKAEKKYEIGKVSDKEEAKQRQLKAILNKLTPQNFEKLFEQVKEVDIDNTVTLAGVISQIFDKALTEPTFCEMYANFCFHLSSELPDFSQNDEKITFRRLLLNKCQEEFERGEREQAEAERVEEEGEMKQSKAQREEKSIKARRRMLGNIRLIGELYKKRMLTERIMHECIQKLLGQYQDPDEEDIEALCKLMSTIGEIIDHPKAKVHMDAYFDRMQKLSTNQNLSSRHRFMLRDAIDLRKNKWQQRRKVEGPKKIEEVHRDAAQERQSQVRSARGPALNSAMRRGPPVDYGPRGSTVLPSPNSQFGGMRGSTQAHGYGIQDVRLEERHPSEKKILSVPLPQRLTDDSSITLGPQGGLARGMSSKGQPLISNFPPVETPSSSGNHRRIASGPNNYSSASDRTSYSSRDSRTADRSSDRFSTFTVPAGQTLGSLAQNSSLVSDAKPLSEEVLREKSIATIREFYSAKDEQEVALCIKELNSPSFYPSMVSLWVTDSFERKDMERDLLARLLVKLCKSHDSLLNQVQLTQGFKFVISSLEEAVYDAPKAPEFLGSLFAKVILENVIPLGDIGRLIHEAGEEPGRLLEVGHASAVVGSILQIIRVEKGDLFVQEICRKSNLQLEDFLPPH